jgi:TM2 domain-containing membrane protein YozV
MIAALPPSASAWTDEQRAMYYAQMTAYQKDEVVGVLLALFLGTFGAHHFYMRQTGLGILYCVFFWTGIPTVVSFIECFFMPGRVRQYNLGLAAYFAANLGGVPARVQIVNALPATGAVGTCSQCGAMLLAGSKYCGQCGARV